MKLKFKGGHKMQVVDPKTKKVSEVERLEQLFEDALYVWPEPGMTLSVPDPVGGWMLYKRGEYLEQVPEDAAAKNVAAPTVHVAVREAPKVAAS
jgi:hypothetical protein